MLKLGVLFVFLSTSQPPLYEHHFEQKQHLSVTSEGCGTGTLYRNSPLVKWDMSVVDYCRDKPTKCENIHLQM